MRKKGSFTLIELVMIIVILGILSAVALPRFFDLQQEARESAEKGVVGGVRAGIATYYANQCVTDTCSWPTALSSSNTVGDCSLTNPCFDNVLQMGGITEDDWQRASANNYVGPAGSTYVYTPADGSFLESN